MRLCVVGNIAEKLKKKNIATVKWDSLCDRVELCTACECYMGWIYERIYVRRMNVVIMPDANVSPYGIIRYSPQ